jgi:hypothetical protein
MNISEWHLNMKENVVGKLDKITLGAERATGKMGALQSSLNKSSSLIGGAKSALLSIIPIASLAAGAMVFGSGVREGIAEVKNWRKEASQLYAGIVSTNGVAGRSFDQLTAKAKELQKQLGFEDDEVMGAESILLTFTKVRNKIFDEALPAAADLATRFKMDLPQAALMMGKALNDPLRGINALRRNGISFTEAQENAIKKLTQAGKLEAAQAIVLKEVYTEVGGSAKAAFDADPLRAFTLASKDIKEQLGGAAISIITKFKPAILSLMEKMSNGLEWIIQNWSKLSPIVYSLGGALLVAATASSILALQLKLTAGWVAIKTLYTQGLTVATAAMTLVTKGWSAAMEVLNITFKVSPIGLVTTLIAALAGAAIYCWNKFEGFRGFLYGLWASIKEVFSGIWDIATKVLGGMAKMIMGIVTLDVNQIKEGFKSFTTGLVQANPVGFIYSHGQKVAKAFTSGYSNGISDFRASKSGVKSNSFDSFLSNQAVGAMASPGKKSGSANSGLQEGINSVTDGGKQQRIINVRLDSLVKELNINTTNLKDGSSNIKEQMIELFLRVLQGGELGLLNE